jgi:threonylcarbamoyladenosine tRNA methylthiotransferase MtaB
VRVFFTNLGCKLNQAEVDALARRFIARGHEVVGSLDDADLHVVNTCTVTSEAARDSRKAARRGARAGHRPRTVLTGCWATDETTVARSLPGVDLVVSNRDKPGLVEIVSRSFAELDASAAATQSPVPISYVPLRFGTARALLQVEDGCDMRCAFCIIPRTRGAQRSRPLDQVVAEARALEAGGHAEVVITGVQISAYRDGAARLPDLLDTLLAATSWCRFRLTSIAPWELDAALLERLAHPRLCRHLHLSLQSGDDRTLRRMRRPYTAAQFAARVAEVRRRLPGAAITTDVIVGYPGETDDEDAASRAFVETMGFARVHAFCYSPRAGTEAANLPDHVTGEAKRARMARMLTTATAAAAAFHRTHLGTIGRVLWEGRRNGHWLGTTDNYLRVFTPAGDRDLRGSVTEVQLSRAVPGGLLAAT